MRAPRAICVPCARRSTRAARPGTSHHRVRACRPRVHSLEALERVVDRARAGPRAGRTARRRRWRSPSPRAPSRRRRRRRAGRPDLRGDRRAVAPPVPRDEREHRPAVGDEHERLHDLPELAAHRVRRHLRGLRRLLERRRSGRRARALQVCAHALGRADLVLLGAGLTGGHGRSRPSGPARTRGRPEVRGDPRRRAERDPERLEHRLEVLAPGRRATAARAAAAGSPGAAGAR